jgi:hypothetical protein
VSILRQRRARPACARASRRRRNISSDRRLRVVPRGLRGALTQLSARRLAAVLLASSAFGLIAASPPPHEAPVANALTKAQMEALLPKTALRTIYVVDVNKFGQVTGAKPQVKSKDANFNIQTYGNALQAFIRTPDDKAISGVYTLTYDYSPKTRKIDRSVALVHPGGVNPDAEGAALVMIDAVKKQQAAAAAAAAKAAAPKKPAPKPSAK